jgi:hypothetical protein
MEVLRPLAGLVIKHLAHRSPLNAAIKPLELEGREHNFYPIPLISSSLTYFSVKVFTSITLYIVNLSILFGSLTFYKCDINNKQRKINKHKNNKKAKAINLVNHK